MLESGKRARNIINGWKNCYAGDLEIPGVQLNIKIILILNIQSVQPSSHLRRQPDSSYLENADLSAFAAKPWASFASGTTAAMP
jgi:hypothetical protein